MMDLIDREAAVEAFDRIPRIKGLGLELLIAASDAKDMLRELPTATAVPVVECEWERMKDGRDILCSVCKARFNPDIRFLTDSQIRYCPHCGAKVVKVKWT